MHEYGDQPGGQFQGVVISFDDERNAMLHRAMRACGQRFSLQTLLLGYLLLLGFVTPGFAQSAGVSKAAQQASSTQVELEGELEVLHEDDFKNKKSRTRHFLRETSGNRYELKFKSHAPKNLLSSSKVKVKGNISGNILYLSSDSDSIQQLSTVVDWATGVQKTAVILVNFQDNPTQPVTPATVQNLVFNTVNNFYLENSFQTISFSGNVLGWYTIPISSTVCDGDAIRTYAKNAATLAGADLSGYTRFVYMFPRISACGWGGAATIGGPPSDSWINGYFELKVVGHELGHNLGLNHSHSLNCDPSPIGNSCTEYDYGDLVDIMGNYKPGHINAAAKEYLGWLNAAGKPPITTVQQSGSYVLEPYAATSTGGNKALKILRSTDPSTGEQTWYYLEFRQPLNFDAALSGTIGNQVSGVEVRSANASQGSFLLDMTPNSNTLSDTHDMFDGALAVGTTFTDATAGVAITVSWANSSGAGIDVVLGDGQTSCKRQAPSVLLSSSQAQPITAGTVVSYTVAVTNNDSSACGPSSFNLQPSLPTGWAWTLGSTLLTIGAGNVAPTTLTVMSPTSTVAGSYNLGVKASNSSSGSGSGSATYSIASTTTSNFATSVTTDKSIYKLGDTVLATITATADGKPVANVSASVTLIKPNGAKVTQTLTTGSNGLALYKYRLNKQKDPMGTYQFGVMVNNSGQTANSSTSFAVQ